MFLSAAKSKRYPAGNLAQGAERRATPCWRGYVTRAQRGSEASYI